MAILHGKEWPDCVGICKNTLKKRNLDQKHGSEERLPGVSTMDIEREDLQKRYEALNDRNLLELQKAGGLTDTASEVLIEEIARRALSDKDIQTAKLKEYEESIRPDAPKVWIGFIFAIAFVIWEFLQVLLPDNIIFRFLPIFIAVLGWLYWASCVQSFHEILRTLTTGGYKISPLKAFAYHFIPFFNFYWIFRWPIELANFINHLGQIKMASGALLGIGILASIGLGRLDGGIGLASLFGIASYINSKIKAQVCLVQNPIGQDATTLTKGSVQQKDTPIKVEQYSQAPRDLGGRYSLAHTTRGTRMNKKQKAVLIAIMVVILGMLLYPPFHCIVGQRVWSAGYSWIFDSPESMGVLATVNVGLLLAQWLGVLIVGGIMWFMLKSEWEPLQKKDVSLIK